MRKKRGAEAPLTVSSGSEELDTSHAEDSVVSVGTNSTDLTSIINEWVSNHTITGLEADFRLERVFTNRTNHS